MSHRDEETDLGALYDHVRRELVEELGMHDTGRQHPGRCLCGGWNGDGTFNEHLADVALAVLYGEP